MSADGGKEMIVCPVHLPGMYLEAIEKLVTEGFYPCRSEVIRVAIRDMLKRDLLLSKKINQQE
jgi:Arc/MetJ-type ribon-helix-helix transcriptional regulator